MKKPIYLDNQATTPVDPIVMDKMLPFFQEHFGNPASVHHFYGRKAKEAVESSRVILAKGINASSREIIFTSGATEAINLAIKGAAENYEDQGKHIITQATEHKAVLDTCKALEKKGWEITILPVNSKGNVDPRSILNAINDDTILVAIMHANNEIGTIQPIKEIGAICQDKNIIFMVDACQTFGKITIDVEKMNIDLLAATSHKIYGPKGIGFLYIRQKQPKINLKMQIDGGGHERGFRSGTLSVPLIVGFGKAYQIMEYSKDEENNYLMGLRDRLKQGIARINPEVMVNGDPDNCLPHNLNLCFPGLDGETLIMRMKGIACSMGSACSGQNLEPSHVIKAIGRETELSHSAIRFSLGRFNSEDDIDMALLEINDVVSHLKKKKNVRKNNILSGHQF
tara:strand:+ start:11380 stop:12573 length:1194 start_codon:yes stop_codon:yes gene_type:complete